MRDIDGSYGEGGGQLLRTACALAAITGEAIRVRNVRARRAPSGLAPQHLMAVKAVGALCEADVEGLELRSQDVVFRPGRLRGGEFRFDVGTAGSVTLVLQALLPAAIASGMPVRIHLIGGTDIRAAPPLDYFRFVLLPLLARMGAEIDATLIRRGYYPRGGGEITVAVQPRRLRPLRLEAPGTVREIRGIAHVSNLPTHIATRMRDTAARILADVGRVDVEQQTLGPEKAVGQGGAIALWTSTERALLGGANVAQRGIPAERIAEAAAQSLREDIAAGATLDVHAADQVLVYAALAAEPSVFLARTISSHAATTLWLLQQLLTLQIHTSTAGTCTRLMLQPGNR